MWEVRSLFGMMGCDRFLGCGRAIAKRSAGIAKHSVGIAPAARNSPFLNSFTLWQWFNHNY